MQRRIFVSRHVLTLIMMKNLRISLDFQDLNDSCDDDGELKVDPYEEF